MPTPTPTRKTYRRPDLGVVRAAKQLTDTAAEIELGWLTLREHLHDSGWPARTPEDDRRDRKPRDTVKCACGQPFPDVHQWQYHADETGHRTRLPVDPDEASALDYSDPTGDIATSGLEGQWHRDLAKLQDLRADLERTVKALSTITAKYRPLQPNAIPICSVGACTEPVETTGTGYRGMERVAGHYIPRAGIHGPECKRHRLAREREAKAA